MKADDKQRLKRLTVYIEEEASCNHPATLLPYESVLLLAALAHRDAEQQAEIDRLAEGLSLAELRMQNEVRGREWDATQLPVTFASTELAGEVGEACNEVKKLERHRVGIPGGKESTEGLAEELADTIIYADLLAARYGIDLSVAVARKFNKTSDKHGFMTKLREPAAAAIKARKEGQDETERQG